MFECDAMFSNQEAHFIVEAQCNVKILYNLFLFIMFCCSESFQCKYVQDMWFCKCQVGTRHICDT